MRGNAERVLIARRRAAVLARRLERRTLGALGAAGLQAAIFADVGVMVLAVLNAIRTLRLSR